MTFSSLIFIFFFLPCLLGVYFLIPRRAIRAKNIVLILFSLIFYSYGEPVYVAMMLFSTLVDYTAGRLIGFSRSRGKKARVFLILSLVVNLGLLGVFKYGDFTVWNINQVLRLSLPLPGLSLPIGISFYTFQTMSYTIDVYRGKAEVQRDFLDLLLYTTLFPQLVAGPIVRYTAIAAEIRDRRVTPDGFSKGFCRFVCGLGKKMLIANRMAVIADAVFGQPAQNVSTATAWLGIIAYTFQIYFDFSGYSDMAIGLGGMFGFHFAENFRYPYASASISEFWRRWHISLGSWFRDYVYFPLGGSRRGRGRNIINLFIVWALTGLWHGASWNFVIWGLYFFIWIALEKAIGMNTRKYHPLRHALTMLLVTLGFVFFRADTLTAAWEYLKNLFFLQGTPAGDFHTVSYLWQYGGVFLLAAAASLPVYPRLKRLCEKSRAGKTALTAVCAAGCIAVFLLCTVFLVNDSYNPFIYFRF